jgi:hypothetical protein
MGKTRRDKKCLIEACAIGVAANAARRTIKILERRNLKRMRSPGISKGKPNRESFHARDDCQEPQLRSASRHETAIALKKDACDSRAGRNG